MKVNLVSRGEGERTVDNCDGMTLTKLTTKNAGGERRIGPGADDNCDQDWKDQTGRLDRQVEPVVSHYQLALVEDPLEVQS